MELKGIGSDLGLGAAFPEVGGAKSAPVTEGAGKFFSELVSKVNDMQVQSDQAIQGLQLGRGLEIQGRSVRTAIELVRSEGRRKPVRHSA